MVLHITAGIIAIATGYTALAVRKGGALHIKAGTVFVYAMICMGAGATLLGLMRGIEWAAVGGPLTAYLVVSAMRTVGREQHFGIADRILTLCGFCCGIAFVILGFTALRAPRGMLDGVPSFPMFMDAFVALAAVAGDTRCIKAGMPTGAARVTRHLWRMCFAMFIATGSFFLGQADVLPKALQIAPALAALAFFPLLAIPIWWVLTLRSFRGPSLRRIHVRRLEDSGAASLQASRD